MARRIARGRGRLYRFSHARDAPLPNRLRVDGALGLVVGMSLDDDRSDSCAPYASYAMQRSGDRGRDAGVRDE